MVYGIFLDDFIIIFDEKHQVNEPKLNKGEKQ